MYLLLKKKQLLDGALPIGRLIPQSQLQKYEEISNLQIKI